MAAPSGGPTTGGESSSEPRGTAWLETFGSRPHHRAVRGAGAAWAVCIGLMVVACGSRAQPRGAEVAEPPTVTPATETEPGVADEAPLRLQEVAPGVFAALQPAPLRFNDSNAAVVVSEAGAVVIDGPQRVTTTRWLAEQVESMTEGPRRILVTTHWHLDHSLGGTVLRSELSAEGVTAEHWGHAELGALVRARGMEQLREHRESLPGILERGEAMRESGTKGDGSPLTREERIQLDEELESFRTQHEAVSGLSLAEPTHPVAEVTRVELGSLILELHPVTAHTDADLLVYVPERKVLITGDVLDELPFGGHGRPRQWLEVLRTLAELEVETIVPGHGAPMGRQAFGRAIALWSAILEQAEQAVAAGQTAEERYAQWEQTEAFAELREATVTDALSERVFAAFVPESLARAMAELRGEI